MCYVCYEHLHQTVQSALVEKKKKGDKTDLLSLF